MAFLSLGLTKGRKHLKGYSSPEASKEYLFHSMEIVLTLAGLAITALALFIGFGLPNLEQLSSIILFFSISFTTLTLSSNFTRFPKRIYKFIADILADTGILAIGCGFLVFFEHHLQSQKGLLLLYGVFILVFLLLSSLDFHKYYKYWSSFEDQEGTACIHADNAEVNRDPRRRYGLNLFYAFIGLLLGIVGNLWASYFMKILELRQYSPDVWIYSFIGMSIVLIVFGFFFLRHVQRLIRE